MKKVLFTLTTFTAIITLVLIACNEKPKIADGTIIISQDSLIKRGSYLVTAMGCDDCHTPKKMTGQGPEPDLSKRFSGHIANEPIGKVDPSVLKEGWILFNMGLTAFVGPWGISYAANISSDATGIGNWSEEQFFTAIRQGKSKGIAEARPLLPPMPWQQYRNLSDTDLKAIFSFLKSTTPQENRVPGPGGMIAAN